MRHGPWLILTALFNLIWCNPSTAQRFVATFDIELPLAIDRWYAVHDMSALQCPTCQTEVVKSYGRRLVLSVTNGTVTKSMVYDLLVEQGVLTVEQDSTVTSSDASEIVKGSLNLTVHAANIISLNSSIWADRWWPVSGPHGLRAKEVWQTTNGSTATVIAMLDSGIPLLAKPIFANIADGYDFISDTTVANDGDGRDANWEDPGDASPECPGPSSWHGTQVAAVLAANTGDFRGVATNATILPIRVLGLCKKGHASDVTDAIVWASGGLINTVPSNPVPATIISMSFSGSGACPSYLQSAVTQAITNGCVLLAAAGNNAASSVDYFPGNCNGVIVVEASTKSGVLAAYSNNRGTLAAPGGDASNPVVTMALDETEDTLVPVAAIGTSLSVPMVAGFLALGLEFHGPSFNLGSTLIPFANNCTMEQCGAGIVSFYGSAHAIPIMVNNTLSYQCSSNAVHSMNISHAGIYDDITISLNVTSVEWVVSKVACNPVVIAATSCGVGSGALPTYVTQISTGDLFTCAILSDTTLKCWGKNDNGQIGNGGTTQQNSPVEVSL